MIYKRIGYSFFKKKMTKRFWSYIDYLYCAYYYHQEENIEWAWDNNSIFIWTNLCAPILNKIPECIAELIGGRPPRDKRCKAKERVKKEFFVYNLKRYKFQCVDQIIQCKQKFLDSWRYKRAYPFTICLRSVLAFATYLLGGKKNYIYFLIVLMCL